MFTFCHDLRHILKKHGSDEQRPISLLKTIRENLKDLRSSFRNNVFSHMMHFLSTKKAIGYSVTVATYFSVID